MIGMGRAITRTPLMAQHVPISFPSPGGRVGGVMVIYWSMVTMTVILMAIVVVIVMVIIMIIL